MYGFITQMYIRYAGINKKTISEFFDHALTVTECFHSWYCMFSIILIYYCLHKLGRGIQEWNEDHRNPLFKTLCTIFQVSLIPVLAALRSRTSYSLVNVLPYFKFLPAFIHFAGYAATIEFAG